MAGQLRAVKRRIVSVQSTKKITRAMELIASSRIVKAQQRVRESSPYARALTRAVSLATRRFGSNFLSVGRVQSPTLGLVVERELERRAHVPKPFWEVFAKFEHPDGSFEAHHATDKFWDEAEANAALAGTKSPGVVKDVTARKNSRKPPTPLNTTACAVPARTSKSCMGPNRTCARTVTRDMACGDTVDPQEAPCPASPARSRPATA